MIRHIVLTRFAPETSEQTISDIYSGLARVAETLPGARNFVGGRSESPEQIERGYMHGFTIDFDSWDALQAYADNEEHKALGGQIVANAQGGLDGVLVLDIET
ncbi:MAG: Dabb family protein [Ruegeria sp.]|uniref:Dabb family protein n=1 Tax=Ruegeria sp. TaxID=1879320 RepID=UPI00349E83E3